MAIRPPQGQPRGPSFYLAACGLDSPNRNIPAGGSRRMRFALAFPALLLLALSGCTATPSPGDAAVEPPSASVAGARVPQVADVIMQGSQFINQTVTIHAGDTVRWTHLDGATAHSVMANDGAFSSNDACFLFVQPHPMCMTNGDTYEVKFDHAGTVKY